MFDDYVPADEEHLLQLRGLPVCVVMNDGTRYFGTLTGCSKDKLTLNGDLDDEPPGALTERTRTKSRRLSRSRKRVRATSKSGSKEKNAFEPEGSPPSDGLGWSFGEPPPRTKVTLPLEPIQAVLLL